MDEVCKIFNCKKSSLMDWIKRYEETKNCTRRNRKPISYKISNDQVKNALDILDKNEQTTMNELVYEMKQKHDVFDITRSKNPTKLLHSFTLNIRLFNS